MTKSTLNSFIEHIQVEYLYNSILSRFGRRKEFIIESLGQVNNIDKYVKNFVIYLNQLDESKYELYEKAWTNINGNLKSKRNMHFKQILNKINGNNIAVYPNI